MLVRMLALLFAALVIGAAPQAVVASQDVVSQVDELPDLITQVVPEAIVVPWPDQDGSVGIDAPSSQAPGRVHESLVFRPPRVLASR